MSSLEVDLRFLEVDAPAAARAAAVDEDRVIAGAMRLWKMCWALKRDTVSRVEVAGAFGPVRLEDLIAALEMALLEPVEGGRWRVRGAARYLRIIAGRSAGGHAAKGNLVPGAKQKKASGLLSAEAERSRDQAESEPRESREAPSAVLGSTPLTDHRSPFPSASQTGAPEVGPRVVYDSEGLLQPTEPPSQVPAKKAPKRRDSSEADPRHQPLVEALTLAFLRLRKVKYPFTPRDAVAVKALLTSGISPPEIVEAWTRALQHVGYPSIATLSEFHDRLAHFVARAPDARAQADPATGWSGTGAVTVTRMEPPP